VQISSTGQTVCFVPLSVLTSRSHCEYNQVVLDAQAQLYASIQPFEKLAIDHLMQGLLFELGPCRIANDGMNVTYNEYSWNEHANILFLDQPVNVGYSYADDGSTVDRSSAAGEDVYIFFQLFFARFPEYASAKFHMAAESYGGTYAPHAASIFHKRNKDLDFAPVPDLVRINLASVILANGLTEPLSQLPTVPEYACNGPYPMYDDPEGPQCTALRSRVPTCERLIKACYNFDSRLTCVPAALYCMGQLFSPLQGESYLALSWHP
jgi:cathepsin A (carboxypeptidase C)